jgi:hypothetical protein
MRQTELYDELTPLLVTIPKAAMMIGRGVTFIYAALGEGKIKGVKSDSRTLVVFESLREYAAKLPPAKIKPIAKRAPQRKRFAEARAA